MLALAFDPVGWTALAWCGMVPLICALWFSEPWTKNESLRLFLLGWVAGMVYFAGSLHWISVVTVAGWLALCAVLAVYTGLWAVFTGGVIRPVESPYEMKPVWLRSGGNLRVAALSAAAWTGLEWVRGSLFTGFGWNGLGVALHENIALIQICDIVGVTGLSFLPVMVNAIIVLTVKRIIIEVGRHKLTPHYDFSLTIALVAMAFAYGVRQMWGALPAMETLSVAAIQTAIPISERRDEEREKELFQIHEMLTETAIAGNPDLLVWPEAALPRPIFLDQMSWDFVRGLAEKFDGDFLLGTLHYNEKGEFNSALLLTDKAKKADFYHKSHLVPFGEYVPLRESFPLFAWIVGDLVPDDFDFGPGPRVLEMKRKPVKLGPLICFEDTLGDLVRRFVQQGAQLFVTVTNDGWFLRTAGSRQHLNQAVFRCAETKVPMVRAANTGVTCVIDRFGRVVNTLQGAEGDTFSRGFLLDHQVAVPRIAPQTFYTRNGNVFPIGCLIAALAVTGAAVRRRIRDSRLKSE